MLPTTTTEARSMGCKPAPTPRAFDGKVLYLLPRDMYETLEPGTVLFGSNNRYFIIGVDDPSETCLLHYGVFVKEVPNGQPVA